MLTCIFCRAAVFYRLKSRFLKRKQLTDQSAVLYGAGDEARTRYLHLGKVALYQMSYTRMSCGTLVIIAVFFKMSRHNP